MARSRCKRRCSDTQRSLSFALTDRVSLRRKRSISTKPPTVRKLKNSTPKNHASTNQRRASGRGDAGICAPAALEGANALIRCDSETADAEAAPIHEADAAEAPR